MIKTFIIQKYSLIREIFIYGLVGISAFITHFSIVFLLVHFFHIHPLIANAIAFIISFNVSFWGHHHFTFSGHKNEVKIVMQRLFAVAVTNFFVNEYFYYILLSKLHLQYLIALLINLTIFALISYVVSKFWVFKFI